MKKLILILALCISGLLCKPASAQVSFGINISTQPVWGPVGYDHVEYYYLPDIDAYYYVPKHRYVYMENGNWISRSNLPARYGNHDMYNTRKVVINERKPYMHHEQYRTKYASVGRSNEGSIRDSHESRYFENKNHPEHSKWKNNNRNEGRHKEQNQEKHGQQQEQHSQQREQHKDQHQEQRKVQHQEQNKDQHPGNDNGKRNK